MEWFTRLAIEARGHIRPLFVTLTYSEAPPLGVEKKHVQDFLKRFRKKTNAKIKYFCVGEYGPKTLRPHYHLILFGYHGPQSAIYDTWQHGHIHVGSVSLASMNYVAKYHVLKTFSPKDKNPSFMLVSKGLGSRYVQFKEWHMQQLRNYIQLYEKKMPLPRYLKEKIFNEDQRKEISGLYDLAVKQYKQLSDTMEKNKLSREDAIKTIVTNRRNKQTKFKEKSNLQNHII